MFSFFALTSKLLALMGKIGPGQRTYEEYEAKMHAARQQPATPFRRKTEWRETVK